MSLGGKRGPRLLFFSLTVFVCMEISSLRAFSSEVGGVTSALVSVPNFVRAYNKGLSRRDAREVGGMFKT